MTKQRGFTLVELIITIAVLGILGAIAVLNAPAIRDTYRVKGAARQIFSDMQMARLRAIKEGKEFAVEFSGTTYCVKNRGTDNDWDAGCGAGAGDDVVKTIDLTSEYPGVSLSNDYGGIRAEFNPNGTATNFGEIICNSTKGQEVTVNNNTGNIRIVNALAC